MKAKFCIRIVTVFGWGCKRLNSDGVIWDDVGTAGKLDVVDGPDVDCGLDVDWLGIFCGTDDDSVGIFAGALRILVNK